MTGWRNILGGLIAALTIASAAPAWADCRAPRAGADAAASWVNPKPGPGDVSLELRGTRIIFRNIDLATDSLFTTNERVVYEMGSAEKIPFETRMKARVGSPVRAPGAKTMSFLFGKYEVSKAQYALVMGNGSLAAGLAVLRKNSRDERLKRVLAEFLEPGDCRGVMTRKLANALAEPVSHLTHADIAQFISTLNAGCISLEICRNALRSVSANREIPGYFRLPTEQEWEFVARGGEAFVAGRIDRDELQLNLPKAATGSDVTKFAHVGSEPARLLPIGSKEPLWGLHDMLGNVGELMLNPFTSENGTGAVGGYVARGGNFRLPARDVRVSKRVELNQFVYDVDGKRFELQFFPSVGVRLMIGLPVGGIVERVGSGELERLFNSGFVSLDDVGGGSKGRTREDARDVGTVKGKAVTVRGALTTSYDTAFFRVRVPDHARLKLDMQTEVPIGVAVTSADGDMVFENRFSRVTTGRRTEPLLPGLYTIGLKASSKVLKRRDFELSLAALPEDDTGVPFPTAAALAKAERLSGSGTKIAGFVGQSDGTDSYPFRLDSSDDGLLVEFEAQRRRDLELRVVDASVQTVSKHPLPRDATSLTLPLEGGFRGFLQVVAGDGPDSHTTYAMSMKAAQLFSPQIAERDTGMVPMRSGSRYKGFLRAKRSRAYALFNLDRPSRVRVDLTGLEANAAIAIHRANTARGGRGFLVEGVDTPGAASELYFGELEAGNYVVEVRPSGGATSTPFALRMQVMESVAPRGTDIETARRQSRLSPTTIALTPGYFGTRSMTGRVDYYRFRVTAGTRYEATIVPTGSDLDIFLEAENGAQLAASVATGTNPDTLFYTAGANVAGGYLYLRVENVGRGTSASYSLLMGSRGGAPAGPVAATRPPNHWSDGRVLSRHADWEVLQKNDGTCFARTLAARVEPETGWRIHRPYFYVAVDRGGSSAYISMEATGPENLLYRGNRARAFVTMGNGRRRNIRVQFDGTHLKPLARNTKLLDSDSLRAFRRGSSVTIMGQDATGRDIGLRYSLSGYTASVLAMNRACRARVQWLLGR